MPRFLSAVTTLSSSLPRVFTQTWRTLLVFGAIQARRLPSGDTCGLTRSGLPKRTSRGISGGSWARAEDRARLNRTKTKARFLPSKPSRIEPLNLVGTARCAVRAAFSGATMPPADSRVGTSPRDVPTKVSFTGRERAKKQDVSPHEAIPHQRA